MVVSTRMYATGLRQATTAIKILVGTPTYVPTVDGRTPLSSLGCCCCMLHAGQATGGAKIIIICSLSLESRERESMYHTLSLSVAINS